jgi:hypothetical protein
VPIGGVAGAVGVARAADSQRQAQGEAGLGSCPQSLRRIGADQKNLQERNRSIGAYRTPLRLPD